MALKGWSFKFYLNKNLSLFASDDQKAKGSGLAPWPARLTSPPPRLADFGYSSDMFEKDTVITNKGIIFPSMPYLWLFSCAYIVIYAAIT